jgi:8-oxo-dGTP pyrophosphatase MutT (NUDIX family)
MPISEYLRALREKIGHDLVMVPGVTALVFNEAGEVLLHRSADDGRWYTVGGAVDPGEEPADAAVREVREETGLHVVPERVVGVYSDPLVTYPNGDKVLYVSTCFVCRAVGGTLAPGDDESLELRYFPPGELPELSATHRHRIQQALKGDPRAYFARAVDGNANENTP